MAQQFLSMNLNNLNLNLGSVVVGTSAPTADFYFQISTTANPTKEQCIMAMKAIQNYLLSNGLPAGQTGVDQPVL